MWWHALLIGPYNCVCVCVCVCVRVRVCVCECVCVCVFIHSSFGRKCNAAIASVFGCKPDMLVHRFLDATVMPLLLKCSCLCGGMLC